MSSAAPTPCPLLAFALAIHIGGVLHADEKLVNTPRNGPLVRLLLRLVVRRGDVGGLLDAPVGLEVQRVHRCAVQKREEAYERRANRVLGLLRASVVIEDERGDWARDSIVL
jgi:hypothetical protein